MESQIQVSSSTSGTVNMQDTGQNVCLIHDAGATLTLTIAFPSTPFNGQEVIICSTNGITTASLTTAVGSILNGITTMPSGGQARYRYLSSSLKWYKIA